MTIHTAKTAQKNVLQRCVSGSQFNKRNAVFLWIFAIFAVFCMFFILPFSVNYFITLNSFLLRPKFCSFMFFFGKGAPIMAFASAPGNLEFSLTMITFPVWHTDLPETFRALHAPGSGLCPCWFLISMLFPNIATWFVLHFLLGNTQRSYIREASLTILYK